MEIFILRRTVCEARNEESPRKCALVLKTVDEPIASQKDHSDSVCR